MGRREEGGRREGGKEGGMKGPGELRTGGEEADWIKGLGHGLQ